MIEEYVLGQGSIKHKLVPWEEVKTLTEFYDRMRAYDWTTAMSDDHRVWQRGEDAWANEFEPCLRRMQRSHGEQALRLFTAMRSWAWGNKELPPRPEEESENE